MRHLALLAALFVLIGAGCTATPSASPQISSFTEPTANANTNASFTPPPVGSPVSVTPSSSKVPLFPGVLPAGERQGKQIRMQTNKGEIVFSLFADEAPIATSNFVWLTSHKFYDGLTFHRYEPGFVIQGGDPDGIGTGGPGWKFRDEPVTRDYLEGTVAMANAGPNTNGSQFFIMLKDTPLPKNYTIFGKVTVGLDVVQKLRAGDTMTKVIVEDIR